MNEVDNNYCINVLERLVDTLNSLVRGNSQETKTYTRDLIAISTQLVKFDPNNIEY